MKTRLMLLALCVGSVACESNEKASNTANEAVKAAATAPVEVTKHVAKAAAQNADRALKAPLPDGVSIDFPYNVVMETSKDVAGVTNRIIMMEPKVPTTEAAQMLAKSFEKAGYARTESDTTIGLSKGGQGAGLAAVATGGTHVAVLFNAYDAGSDRIKEGYTGMINITVNSKASTP